jgi:hypothetical protein
VLKGVERVVGQAGDVFTRRKNPHNTTGFSGFSCHLVVDGIGEGRGQGGFEAFGDGLEVDRQFPEVEDFTSGSSDDVRFDSSARRKLGERVELIDIA